jgi:hypothetical protein
VIADVSALFVDTKGIYPQLVWDCWGKDRDARLYPGSNPVVAHPPCNLWVNYAALNYKRYGGEHNRPGNDGGCFERALRAVRNWGGVLEHPAESKAWAAHHLPPPMTQGWTLDHRDPIGHRAGQGYICEVWQSAYGHKARKRTWLYYVGKQPPLEADWSRNPGTHQCGWFDRIKPTLSKREASGTPPAFAEYLISLARNSRTP